MRKFVEWLEEVPGGWLVICQLMAFDMAAGMPYKSRLKVVEVQRNDRGMAIRLQRFDEDGRESGCGIPSDFIGIATASEPTIILSSTGNDLIGGYEPQPVGLFYAYLIGIPTLILTLPVTLAIRSYFRWFGWSHGMNAQMATTFSAIRDQLDAETLETLRTALRNAHSGTTVHIYPLNMRFDLGPYAQANF